MHFSRFAFASLLLIVGAGSSFAAPRTVLDRPGVSYMQDALGVWYMQNENAGDSTDHAVRTRQPAATMRAHSYHQQMPEQQPMLDHAKGDLN
jgi:hypothetical protein